MAPHGIILFYDPVITDPGASPGFPCPDREPRRSFEASPHRCGIGDTDHSQIPQPPAARDVDTPVQVPEPGKVAVDAALRSDLALDEPSVDPEPPITVALAAVSEGST